MLFNPANKYTWIIESSTGNAVAYGWWQHAKGKTEEERAATYANRYRPEGMNKALMDVTSGARFLKRAKLLNTRDTLILKELYAYTEASKDGYGLYVKYGFEEVDRVTVDLEPWGGRPGELNSYGLLMRAARN
ncbi:hypothetical protein BO94DRAFT_590564 [Aspergillus sclerotioniger CBS 115572]|uniref:N-acetyltransferase domain-containing protein n=1 Tax=Aspergillus sclerotioniger CBS 115572 TaxID=1450535 RepID=A0A317V831_9EURO|nr:hypothetical protein BO94DRAFT_590564 [Aspergillus sclerotioniger CBS 115572]PWY68982.1 hypothetical protein BO94DRAFT_590564 [Aspergillus sclerotioniger CBS 115572]